MTASLLRCLTITGADDGVDPSALADLSQEFHFVEWGILFSPKHTGTSRYPSMEWERRLGEFWSRVRCAAHFCGDFTRRTLNGDPRVIETTAPWFRRIQLNGADVGSPRLPDLISVHRNIEFILQARSRADLSLLFGGAHAMHDEFSVLYDPSGGQGVRPDGWPADVPDFRVGYAGGIGPDNVRGTLEELARRGQAFWIDMETGVRTDDRFDLGLVRSVLETARDWLRSEGAR